MLPRLKDRESIEEIIQAMSVTEKAEMITGETYFSTKAFEKYGIPAIRFLDCASGINLGQYYIEAGTLVAKENGTLDRGAVREGEGSVCGTLTTYHVTKELREHELTDPTLSPEARVVADYMIQNILPDGNAKPTAFPCGMSLGASFDRETARKVGEAAAQEAAAFKLDVLLGTPNINILRDPLCGRLFEGISEDPYVVCEIAPEVVNGVQSRGIGADIKHFAANNQETLRQGIDERISERALYEIYLPGYKACVEKANPATVMSAYNKINGVCCSENTWLLRDTLKKAWNYEGCVISDWGACYYQVPSIIGGNDLDMPGPRNVQPIIDAVESGELDEALLNDAVRRTLLLVLKAMEWRKTRKLTLERENSLNVAYQAAAEAITLLKNDGVLPLEPGCKISFFGEKSRSFLIAGEGSARVITNVRTNVYDEAAKITGVANVEFGELSPDSDVAVITASKPSAEGSDHENMELPAAEKEMLICAAKKAREAGKKVVLLLNTGGPVETEDFIDLVDAVLWVYYPGSMGGKAAADILFGKINPSGKLTLTYPKRYKDCPSYGFFPGDFETVYYGEGIYVGYRYYDKKDIDPLFPFGYGLSYTSFTVSDLKLEKDSFDLNADDVLNVSVKVKNTGDRAGKETVQLYIADEVSLIPKPVKELKGFEKVWLQPGEEKTVTFKIRKADLACYDEKYHDWVSEPGWYQVQVGNSSRNISCCGRFRAYGHSRYDFGEDTHMLRIIRRPEVLAEIGKGLEGIMLINQLVACVTLAASSPFGKVYDFLIRDKVKAAGRDPDEVFAMLCRRIGEIDSGEK